MPGKIKTRSGRPDCLFIHAGKYAGGWRDILLLPLGTLALADRLTGLGCRAEILNAALLPDPLGGAVAAALKKRPLLIGVTLHWHQQAAAAVRLCAELKRRLPGTPVVLGGYTASAFPEEALRASGADYLIKGEADDALPALVRAVRAGRRPGEIPNLYRRDGGRVLPPARQLPARPASFGASRATDYSLVANRADYLRIGKEPRRRATRLFTAGDRRPVAYLAVGRGCTGACSYCGGGAGAQRLLNARTGPAYKPVPALLRELKALSAAGLNEIYLSYDPPGAAAFYSRLFAGLRRCGPELRTSFECWRPPSAAFAEDFARTFARGSRLILSPDCGSRAVRAANGRGDYSNDSLERAVRHIAGLGLKLQLHFTSGLPFETARDFKRTLELARRLRRAAPCELSAGAIEIEPCSPVYLRPEKYGIRLKRRSFADFLAAGKGGGLGYETAAFTERRILGNIAELERLAD
ncbi:MAG: hypothetical protein CVU79_10305 [Elusimicrobia bacterium HGW-Elusimicrobia-3]|nr:MAG: hypothetical protein CVU79_10305 [Elusimicrobia bacterium HGW-Elusimicrobia-3]